MQVRNKDKDLVKGGKFKKIYFFQYENVGSRNIYGEKELGMVLRNYAWCLKGPMFNIGLGGILIFIIVLNELTTHAHIL